MEKIVLKTAIVVLGVVLATGSLAEERRNAPPRDADMQGSAERPQTRKPSRPSEVRDPSVKYCGGRVGPSICIHPVF